MENSKLDKQTSEMAKDLENHTCMSEYQAEIASKMLYIKGYRKASEVVAEIIDVLADIYDYWRNDDCIRESCAIILAIAELKKKYIGEDTNVTTKESEKDNG